MLSIRFIFDIDLSIKRLRSSKSEESLTKWLNWVKYFKLYTRGA
jgi:hypothetical protein